MDLTGKIALITGGAKRIGRQTALALAQAGTDIIIHYHTSSSAAQATAQEVRSLGRRATTMQADMRQVTQVEQMVTEAAAYWGGLDILVNNAAVFYPTSLGTVTEAQWDELLQTNLKGPFFCAQKAGLLMKKAGSGVIINMADTGLNLAWSGYIPYLAAKAGLVQMTYGLARALAPQVRVNAIAPGPVLLAEDSPPDLADHLRQQTLLKRLGKPEDIATAISYLARSDYITGVVLPVDGGQQWR